MFLFQRHKEINAKSVSTIHFIKMIQSLDTLCWCLFASPHQCCAAICWCFRSSWRWWCHRPAWCPWLLCSRRWWWCGTVPALLCPCTEHMFLFACVFLGLNCSDLHERCFTNKTKELLKFLHNTLRFHTFISYKCFVQNRRVNKQITLKSPKSAKTLWVAVRLRKLI